MSWLRLLRFVLVFSALYGLLMLPWLDLQPIYGPYIRGFGSIIFGRSGQEFLASLKDRSLHAPTHVVLFRAKTDIDKDWSGTTDTMIIFGNTDKPREPQARLVRLDSKQVFGIPFSFYLALVGATSIPWARRGWCLLWGLLTAHIHLMLYLAMVLAVHKADISIIYLSSFSRAFATDMTKLLSVVSGPSILIYFFVWIFAAFPQADLIKWASGWREAITPSATEPTLTRQQKRSQLRAAKKTMPADQLPRQPEATNS